LVTYLLLTLAETFREGFVSNFFNINYLLAVVLVSGVAMVLTESEVSVKKFRKRVSKAVIILTIKEERKAIRTKTARYYGAKTNANKAPASKNFYRYKKVRFAHERL
jgi:hypothetical protein